MIFKSIKVEIQPGTDMEVAAHAMQSISHQFRCPVDSVFNGVDIFIEPNEVAEDCVNRYCFSLCRKRDPQGRVVDEVEE